MMAPYLSPFHTPKTEDLLESVQRDQLTRRLMHTLGGFFPDQPAHPATIRRVLDVGCGPGTWTNEYALAHLEQQVVGVETSGPMIEQARLQAQRLRVPNVQHHRLEHYRRLLPLSAAYFDLIHLQRLDVPWHVWPVLLHECARVLRPGGALCLLAWESPITNAPAWEELTRLRRLAEVRAGYTSPQQAHSADLLSALGRNCTTAGFTCTSRQCRIRFSYGARGSEEWQMALLLSQTAKQQMLDTGSATEDQLRALCRQQQQEMRTPTFRAILPVLILWGKKPQ